MAPALAKKRAAAGLFAAPCEGGWEAGEGGCWQSSVASHNLPARGICAEQTGTLSGASAIRGPLCRAFLNRCTCSSDCCAVARLHLFSRSFLIPSPRPFSFISPFGPRGNLSARASPILDVSVRWRCAVTPLSSDMTYLGMCFPYRSHETAQP